jgi:deoxycytidylate deaminase
MSKKRFEITALAYDKRGRMLSIGRNSYIKTHSLQAKFAKQAGRPQAIYVHAELAALMKARRKVHKLVVVRYNKDGSPGNAKPCEICELAIKEFGVKYVEHT